MNVPPAVEAADTRLLLSERGGSFWIKGSFRTVGAEGAWPDQAQTHTRSHGTTRSHPRSFHRAFVSLSFVAAPLV